MQRALVRTGLGLCALLLFVACEGCEPAPPAPDGGGDDEERCHIDLDCALGHHCVEGACVPGILADAGPLDDGGAANDAGLAGAAVLAAVPADAIEFGAQRIGVPVQQQVSLVNIGDAPLTIVNIYLDGDDTGEFEAAPVGSLGVTLNPDDSLPIYVTHTPADGVPDTAALKVAHSANPDELFTILLFAEFKGEPRPSVTTDALVLEPDVATVSLGDVPLGFSATRELFVRNDGSNDSVLVVTGVLLTPGNAGFSVDHAPLAAAGTLSSFDGFCPGGAAAECPAGADACTGGLCLDTGGALLDTLPVAVSFDATVLGPKQATLTLRYQSGESTQQLDVDLVAEGVLGNLQADPGAVTFAGSFTGRPYSQTVTITNTGDAAVQLDDFAFVDGAPFSVVHTLTLPRTMSQNDSVAIEVHYDPVDAGAHGDVLTVLSDQPVDLTVDVSGDARAEPTILVDDTLDFGEVYGGTTRTLPLVIRNDGPGVLSVSQVSITGALSSLFSASVPPLPKDVEPLAQPADPTPNLTVLVSYTPTTAAPNGFLDEATLEITSDDPDAPASEVLLSGMRIKPAVVVSCPDPDCTLVDFGVVTPGDTATDTITITNQGAGNLTISSVELQPGAPFTLQSSTTLPAVLSFGAPLTLTVDFQPPQANTYVGNVVIRSNDATKPTVNVTLVGGGDPCDPRPNTYFVQDGASCTYFCNPDFWDLDGDLNAAASSGGCEYACPFVSDVDEPDADLSAGYIDADCDGIDGHEGGAIFVSPLGSDANSGTSTLPLRNLDTAILRANTQGLDVYVAGGSYAVLSTLSVRAGVSVFGGYDADDWSVRSANNVVQLSVDDATAVLASNIGTTTILDRMTIVGGDSAIGSAYGVRASSSDGLVLRNLTIEAGRGLDGGDGTSYSGARAAAGGDGGRGGDGCEDSSGTCNDCNQPGRGSAGSSSCGDPGGRGGLPGKGSNDGQAGEAGSSGSGGAGGAGTPDGWGNWDPPLTYRGKAGADGSDGGDGAAGYGTYFSYGYSRNPGQNGVTGADGKGGGGGGGGGGGDSWCDSYGGGGGGGGGGGCGGRKGDGGTSGGGSFAIYLWDSNVIVESCTLRTRGGGRGGDGGAGELGGYGGNGGRSTSASTPNAGNNYGGGGEQDDGSNGGKGGDGGDGGDGGHGGGGAGGPSIGVLIGGDSSPSVSSVSYDLGNAGGGGSSSGNDGPAGLKQNVYDP